MAKNLERKNKEILKEKRKLYNEKKKQEKMEQMTLLEPSIKLTPEEEQLKKEQQKKEKRAQYNATRKLKRAQEKENSIQNQTSENVI
jgi:hypothetical protein